ncbi:MAG TPA: beta-ketoacyl synthase chain length factor, partial [Steroidobacteraceae bacterium]|nr:beta-ketoacyl synthase chain length factor [Steroidobacteraceae bacterium]
IEALSSSGQRAETPSTVFTSSGGDGTVIHEICEALARPDREVSPTRFHNSVHNAPAGYWSIALRSHAPSTSLCAFDWSFAAGLVEAGAQLATDQEAVLLVSYDLPYPEPLEHARPITGAAGTALLLLRERTMSSLAQLDVDVDAASRAVTRLDTPGLEALRAGNPTARALPLLRALAVRAATDVVLDYLGTGVLAIKVTPC